MSRQPIALSEIDVEGLIRRPRPARVAAVALSMLENGQHAPIEVWPIPSTGRFQLTRGWVRLEAAKSLGWAELDAVVKRGSPAERRKREIDDNLLQDGNTVLDRARYLAAGKAIYEAENPETRHGGAQRFTQVAKLGHLKPYFGWAAEKYGLAERSVRRACQIGEGLDAAAVNLIEQTAWADHQQALETLATLAPEHQRSVASLLTRDPHPFESLSAAVEAVVGVAPVTPEKKRYSAAFSNFAAMGARERKSWMRQVVEDDLVPPGVVVTFEGGA